MSKFLYVAVKDNDLGIYEIMRVDTTHNFVVVQTNIRTYKKAVEACNRWQQREREKWTNTTSEP